MRYSIFSLLSRTLGGHRGWQPMWRDAAPRPAYDVIIIGGGGHGLATAHYLASRYGISNVAVLEKGWIGGGNVGRNTTIIRSNYLLPGNIPLYELSMKLWEGLEQDLNYNAMVSQRGVLNLYHSDASATPMRDVAMRCGCTASMPNCWIAKACAGSIRSSISTRRGFRSRADCCSARGGTVRHDAVAWGFARGAERPRRRPHPELRGHRHLDRRRPRQRRRDHARPDRARQRSRIAVAGNSSRVAAMAGLRLPIELPCAAGVGVRGIEADRSPA